MVGVGVVVGVVVAVAVAVVVAGVVGVGVGVRIGRDMSKYKIGDWVLVTGIYNPDTYIIVKIIRSGPNPRKGKTGMVYFFHSSTLSTYPCSPDHAWYVPDDATWSEEIILGKEIDHA